MGRYTWHWEGRSSDLPKRNTSAKHNANVFGRVSPRPPSVNKHNTMGRYTWHWEGRSSDLPKRNASAKHKANVLGGLKTTPSQCQ